MEPDSQRRGIPVPMSLYNPELETDSGVGVWLTLFLQQEWCLAVVCAEFPVPSSNPATFAIRSYNQAMKPRWVSSDRFPAQAGDLLFGWWVGVVTLSWQWGVWRSPLGDQPVPACLYRERQLILPREELWYPPGMSFLQVEGSCQDRELLITVSIYSLVFRL